MQPWQDLILRGTIRRLKAVGWSNTNIRAAVQAQASTINPPPIAQAALDALFIAEGV